MTYDFQENGSLANNTKIRKILFKGHTYFIAFCLITSLFNLYQNPEISMINNFMNLYFIFMIPFLLVSILFLYIVQLTNPSNLPKGTTLYQIMHSPNIMIGAIKIVAPLDELPDSLMTESSSIEE